jgi:predicted porin
LYRLNANGYRESADYNLLDKNPNTNFNLWNIDLNFEWWFAPGSNLVFLYRNQIFNRDNNSGLDYYKSLKNLFDIPIEHQLSLRLNYLIDVNRFRRK